MPARAVLLTNFYPEYDGANDQVDPVLPVRSARFQRVVPRYRLSTSETRDQGTGPAFISVPLGPEPERRVQSPPERVREVFRDGGRLVDFYA
jgi:hypothetical protein